MTEDILFQRQSFEESYKKFSKNVLAKFCGVIFVLLMNLKEKVWLVLTSDSDKNVNVFIWGMQTSGFMCAHMDIDIHK